MFCPAKTEVGGKWRKSIGMGLRPAALDIFSPFNWPSSCFHKLGKNDVAPIVPIGASQNSDKANNTGTSLHLALTSGVGRVSQRAKIRKIRGLFLIRCASFFASEIRYLPVLILLY